MMTNHLFKLFTFGVSENKNQETEKFEVYSLPEGATEEQKQKQKQKQNSL